MNPQKKHRPEHRAVKLSCLLCVCWDSFCGTEHLAWTVPAMDPYTPHSAFRHASRARIVPTQSALPWLPFTPGENETARLPDARPPGRILRLALSPGPSGPHPGPNWDDRTQPCPILEYRHALTLKFHSVAGVPLGRRTVNRRRSIDEVAWSGSGLCSVRRFI